MDAGTLCLQATDVLNYFEPKRLFTPLDFGLVGFSFPAGLGIKLAAPERPVVSCHGDGGMGMVLAELSTAVDNNINTTTIVFNNGSWGAEKSYQKEFFNKRYIGAEVSSPQFDKVAEPGLLILPCPCINVRVGDVVTDNDKTDFQNLKIGYLRIMKLNMNQYLKKFTKL